MKPEWTEWIGSPTMHDPEDDSEEQDESGAQVMTVEDFREACRFGAYVDDDGVGYLGTALLESDVPIACSRARYEAVAAKYTHVWWYNK
jgi:hypothetical protein